MTYRGMVTREGGRNQREREVKGRDVGDGNVKEGDKEGEKERGG